MQSFIDSQIIFFFIAFWFPDNKQKFTRWADLNYVGCIHKGNKKFSTSMVEPMNFIHWYQKFDSMFMPAWCINPNYLENLNPHLYI